VSKISPGVLAPPREVLTPDEWRARGRERRSLASRSSHTQWAPPADRPDPVTVLEEQAKTRVPDLIPIRYGRMLASPFAYFRGAAAPMAWDLAHTPTPDIRVQACGDAHLLNFGMYAAPDRRLVFDVNDFDETLPAPFEWDVKRLAASFAVAARDNGFNDRDARAAARLAVRSYRTEMAGYAAMPFLKVWYSSIDIDEVNRQFDMLQPKEAVRRRHRDIAKAYRRTSLTAFLRMCDQVEGQYRIRPAHPVIVRFPVERHPGILEDLRSAVALYEHTLEADLREVLRHYYFGDFARKIVGVGSVGTETLVMLLIGDRADEPLFLQVKEAQESVLAPFAGPGEYEHQGQRVVMGQRLTQATTDPFLGWTTGAGTNGVALKHYYVRQLRDMKGSMSVPDGPAPARLLRQALRLGPRPGARPDRAGHHDLRLPGRGRGLRPRHRGFRCRLRRPERAGLPAATPRRLGRARVGGRRAVTARWRTRKGPVTGPGGGTPGGRRHFSASAKRPAGR
jgi:uncharacterized protein (DUF2252 family)